MSSPFLRSARHLEGESFRRPRFGLLLAFVLLGLWTVWFFLARTAIYATSDTAAVEVDQKTHPVEAPVAGRVVLSRLLLGQDVQAGDVLVELDATSQHLELNEERRRREAFGTQLDALRREIAAAEAADAQEREAARVALDEARERLREAEAALRFAKEDTERHRQLYEAGLGPVVDLHRAEAVAQQRQAEADRLRLAVDRLARQQEAQESERQAHLGDLQRQQNRLAGEEATAKATLERLDHEVDLRHIRAPVSGRLGEVAQINVGAVVSQGQPLAAVVPAGRLRVVAAFSPQAALGRIRAGQPARLRLTGFPWTQYGSIAATVTQVANEVRDGHIRVELALQPDPQTRIPLQHGLPGTVEVEVERISPAALVLRAAGRLLATPHDELGSSQGTGANP